MTPSLFFGKAAEYSKYRVDYPVDVIRAALDSVRYTAADIVADLGSGTGMLSRWFLERGSRVVGVEPDAGMRRAAEASLSRFGHNFASVDGTAERTSLPDATVTLVSTGNAFHYFDPDLARSEVGRILQPDGRVLIVWHDTASKPNAFMREHHDFIARASNREVWMFHQDDRMPRSLTTFFGGTAFHDVDMGDYTVPLTWDALRGRFLSTSVAPPEGDERRPALLSQLAEIHRRFEDGGTVPFQLRWRYVWSSLADRDV